VHHLLRSVPLLRKTHSCRFSHFLFAHGGLRRGEGRAFSGWSKHRSTASLALPVRMGGHPTVLPPLKRLDDMEAPCPQVNFWPHMPVTVAKPSFTTSPLAAIHYFLVEVASPFRVLRPLFFLHKFQPASPDVSGPNIFPWNIKGTGFSPTCCSFSWRFATNGFSVCFPTPAVASFAFFESFPGKFPATSTGKRTPFVGPPLWD